MSELGLLTKAVEELHEPDRLLDLLLDHLAAEQAPPELIERFQADRLAYLEWLEQ
jgi:hypothetical protein